MTEQDPPLLHEVDRLLLGLVDELRHQPPRLLSEGTLPQRALERLLQATGLTPDRGWPASFAQRRLSWLLELGGGLGLFELAGTTLLLHPGPAAQFFRSSADERIRLAWLAWQKPEPALPGLTGERPGSRASRRKLSRVLAQRHRDGACSLAVLLQAWPRPGSERAGEATAVPPELTELLELGVLDRPAWEQGQIMLTPAGAYALGAAPRPVQPGREPGRIVVQPTFIVVVMAPEQELELLYEVGRFARAAGPPPTYSYQLTPRSVVRAGQEGLILPRIRQFLERWCRHPLPQNVVHTLQDWAAAQERLVIRRQATLVEATDPAELEEVLPFAELSPGVRRVNPTFLLVPARTRDQVVQVLGTREFADLDYAVELPPGLAVGPRLEVRPQPKTANLWTPWLLQQFTRVEPTTEVHRLDPERIRQLLERSGPAGVERVRRTLTSALVGGLPPEIELVLRGVEGQLEAVRLVEGTILQTGDAAALEALLRMAAVQTELIQRVGPTLALLRSGAPRRLARVLAELGLLPGCQLPEPVPEEREPRLVTEPDAILEWLRRAAVERDEVIVTYDPGARRTLEEVRVQAREVTSRKGRHYLHALPPGQSEDRVFSLSYVKAVRLLR